MPNEGQEEQKFVFEKEEMENEHVQLNRRQAACLGRETTAALELNRLIKKNMERGPSNLSMPERNLVKVK